MLVTHEGLDGFVVSELVTRALAGNPDYAIPYALYCQLVLAGQRNGSRHLALRNPELAARLGVGERAVSRALSALVAVGVVRVEYPGGNHAQRRLHVVHTPSGKSRERLLAIAAGQLTLSQLRKATGTPATELVPTRSLDAATTNGPTNGPGEGGTTHESNPCLTPVQPLSNPCPTPVQPPVRGDYRGDKSAAVHAQQFDLLGEQSGDVNPPNPPSTSSGGPAGPAPSAQATQAKPASAAPAKRMRLSGDALWTSYGPARQADVTQVLAAWARLRGTPDAKHTPKRRSVVHARLSDGFTPAQLIAVVEHCLANPFYRGQNDRGRAYDDVETLLRSLERVERHLRDIALGNDGKRRTVDRTQRHLAASDRPLEEDQF